MHIVFLKNDMPYHLTFVVNNIKPTDTNLDILYEVSQTNIVDGHFPIINDGKMPFYSALKKWNDADNEYLPKILFLTDINGMSFEEGLTFINANNHNPEIQRLILREFKQNHPTIKVKRNKIHSLKSGCFNKVLNTFLTYY
jgi:hypothetical protein